MERINKSIILFKILALYFFKKINYFKE